MDRRGSAAPPLTASHNFGELEPGCNYDAALLALYRFYGDVQCVVVRPSALRRKILEGQPVRSLLQFIKEDDFEVVILMTLQRLGHVELDFAFDLDPPGPSRPRRVENNPAAYMALT
jgi:hypothetical protein